MTIFENKKNTNMRNLNVNWQRPSINSWFKLNELDCINPFLVNNGVKKEGIYIIWSDRKAAVVRIGSGIIVNRLYSHLNNPEITKYGNLLFTFAEIPEEEKRLSVETYLGSIFDCLVGERFPDKQNIKVNLPDNGIHPNNNYIKSIFEIASKA